MAELASGYTTMRAESPRRSLWPRMLLLLAATLGPALLAFPATTSAKLSVGEVKGAAYGGAVAEQSIIGGSPISIAERPWQVAVLQRGEPICGGSLLAPTVVVTAAHCIVNIFGKPKRARVFDVVTGRTRMSSSEGQELAVRKVHTFRRPTPRWDVALLELRAPSTSETIKIAGPDERALWAQGRDAYISGWGWAERKPPWKSSKRFPDVLRGAKVQINSDARCRSVFVIYDKELMLCAGGGAPERDSCYGDSGGPLVVPTAAGDYRLVGDVSFGELRCGPGTVYGRLAAEPIRGLVRAKVLELTGIDVVGSGAAPVIPTMAFNPLTRGLAVLRALRFVVRACVADRHCLGVHADRCRPRRAPFTCKIRKFRVFIVPSRLPVRRWIKRATLIRELRVWEAEPGGAIEVRKLGHWKERSGWKRPRR